MHLRSSLFRTIQTFAAVAVLTGGSVLLRAQTLYTPNGLLGTTPGGNNNVGIGTSAPTFLLDVNGIGNAMQVRAGGRSHLSYYAPSDEAVFGNDPSNWNCSLRVGPSGLYAWVGGATRLFVSPLGNVGVGTASPDTLLTTNGPIHILSNDPLGQKLYLGTGKITHFIGVETGTTNYDKWEYDEGLRFVRYEDGARLDTLFLTSSGYVGIGTTTPRERLQIGDKFTFHDGGFKVLAFNAYYSGTWKALTAGPTGLFTWDTNAGEFVFSTGGSVAQDAIAGGSDKLTIRNDGNVGIGTTSPTHKLSVNGTIRAKEVIVDSGWADHVFTPAHRLAPLAEVEQHIAQHGRLPGLPSAEQVAAEGISISEAQRLLLEKVEELTLHMIELKKQVAAQQLENEALRALLREPRRDPVKP